MNKYTPLHCHSDFSLLDGLSKPSRIAQRINELGFDTCALTDHGTISGAVSFLTTLQKENIKPILGCELYLCNEHAAKKDAENKKLSHLPVLAKNNQGWQTLIKIVSQSNLPEHFYYKPRLSPEQLATILDGNIIGFSGHLGSDIANALIDENDQVRPNWKTDATRLAKWFLDVFGKNNFYLEVQLMDVVMTPLQKIVGDMVREISKITKIPTIATPDAHYAYKEDTIDQRVLLCSSLKTTMANGATSKMSGFFNSDCFHIPSYNELRIAGNTEEELENTNLVSSQIEQYTNILHNPMLPPFDCPGSNPDEYLRQLCRNGWQKLIQKNVSVDKHQIYADRIKYELEVLQGANLSSYFLIVQDILNYVRQNKQLPGPGRGSAAGCLVSYLIRITTIDPIKYDLIFERFYNPGRNTKDRISMPDIDIDIPVGFRSNVIEYLKNKYGKNKVGQMITYQTLKGRSAMKEVFRAWGGISFEEQNKITHHIPDEAKIADELQQMKQERGTSSIIQWALEHKARHLAEWCQLNDDGTLAGPLANRFEQAIRLEGVRKSQSKHPAGIVISPLPLEDICPLVYDSSEKQVICGMEMEPLEQMGLLKLDVLGLNLLDKLMGIQNILRTGEIHDYN